MKVQNSLEFGINIIIKILSMGHKLKPIGQTIGTISPVEQQSRHKKGNRLYRRKVVNHGYMSEALKEFIRFFNAVEQ